MRLELRTQCTLLAMCLFSLPFAACIGKMTTTPVPATATASPTIIALPVSPTSSPPSLQMIRPDNATQISPAMQLGKGAVNDLAWSPNGGTLAVATWLGVYLYDAATLSQVRFISTLSPALAAVFSPDGAQVAGAISDGSVRVWDGRNGRQVQVFTGHTQPVFSVSFSPDGQVLASSGRDGTLRLWILPKCS